MVDSAADGSGNKLRVTFLEPRIDLYLSPKAIEARNTAMGRPVCWCYFDDEGEQRFIPPVYFLVRVKLVNDFPEDASIQILANVINRCITENKIEPRFTMGPFVVPASLSDASQGFFGFYTYSKFDRKTLNAWLGNEGFIKPGVDPSSDISSF